MKKTLLIALFAAFAISAQAASVTLTSPGALTPGSSFDIEVKLTSVFAGLAPTDSLIGYGFTVSIGNPLLVSFTGETASPDAIDISSNPGVAPVIGGIFLGLGPADITEPYTLVTLHFDALLAGATTISISSDPLDFNQSLTFSDLDSPAQPISASVDVIVAQTPEPSTLGLGLVALGAIGALKRKRFGA